MVDFQQVMTSYFSLNVMVCCQSRIILMMTNSSYIIVQIVCSFLVRDMGIDWRMGAEWFETCLLDYDPCSNYGNWTYGAGDFK